MNDAFTCLSTNDKAFHSVINLFNVSSFKILHDKMFLLCSFGQLSCVPDC